MRYTSLVLTCLLSLSAMPSAQKMEKPGITNYTKVDAVVACGGATETSALEGLKKDGFKTVINLREASESGANVDENAAKAKALGLNYLHIPMNGQAPQAKTLDDFLAAISNKDNQPVYIHCASANRVGAVWLVKRVMQDGWPIPKATDEAKMIGLRSPQLEQFALKYIEDHKK